MLNVTFGDGIGTNWDQVDDQLEDLIGEVDHYTTTGANQLVAITTTGATLTLHGAFSGSAADDDLSGILTGFSAIDSTDHLIIDVSGLSGTPLEAVTEDDDYSSLLADALGGVSMDGDEGNDDLQGDDGDDDLSGGDGDDDLNGGGGDDHVHGGMGHDQLAGGHGNDDLQGNDGDDDLQGEDGDDDLRGGEGDDDLQGGLGHDTLTGGGGMDTVAGGGSADDCQGGAGLDHLRGQGGNDDLQGGGGSDTLSGGTGDDVVHLDNGRDDATGGLGNDQFVLNTDRGVDRIEDFSAGEDQLALDHEVFAALGVGAMDASQFVAAGAAGDGNDYLVYDQAAGTLYYDATGNAGTDHAILQLGHGTVLTAADIVVI
jgi:Ca2+-binding RTX toxin-like protein